MISLPRSGRASSWIRGRASPARSTQAEQHQLLLGGLAQCRPRHALPFGEHRRRRTTVDAAVGVLEPVARREAAVGRVRDLTHADLLALRAVDLQPPPDDDAAERLERRRRPCRLVDVEQRRAELHAGRRRGSHGGTAGRRRHGGRPGRDRRSVPVRGGFVVVGEDRPAAAVVGHGADRARRRTRCRARWRRLRQQGRGRQRAAEQQEHERGAHRPTPSAFQAPRVEPRARAGTLSRCASGPCSCSSAPAPASRRPGFRPPLPPHPRATSCSRCRPAPRSPPRSPATCPTRRGSARSWSGGARRCGRRSRSNGATMPGRAATSRVAYAPSIPRPIRWPRCCAPAPSNGCWPAARSPTATCRQRSTGWHCGRVRRSANAPPHRCRSRPARRRTPRSRRRSPTRRCCCATAACRRRGASWSRPGPRTAVPRACPTGPPPARCRGAHAAAGARVARSHARRRTRPRAARARRGDPARTAVRSARSAVAGDRAQLHGRLRGGATAARVAAHRDARTADRRLPPRHGLPRAR